MARPQSAASNDQPTQLVVRRATLDRRWPVLSTALNGALQLGGQVQIAADYHSQGATAGFVGWICERVDRNRGGQSNVVPFIALNGDLLAWMGYYEVWRLVPGTLPYAFRELSLTVHIGQQGDPIKPQVFRSEWAGVSDWGSGEIGFQAAGAGHPHWQLDALESLAAFAEPPQFDPDPGDEVATFEAAAPAPTELLQSVTVERIHFASAADWWMPVPKGGLARHLNAPNGLDDLTLWATSCVEYLRQELGRCERR
jgi:hypothetical protein